MLPHQDGVADGTILWTISLFPRTIPADHPIRVLVGMVLSATLGTVVVAFIAWVYLGAAAEAEPAVGFAIVLAAAVVREWFPGSDAKSFFLRFPSTKRKRGSESVAGNSQELDLGDFEGRFLMAFSANGKRALAPYRDDAWGRMGSGA